MSRKNYTFATRLKLLGIKILRFGAWTTSDHKNLDWLREHVLKDKRESKEKVSNMKACKGCWYNKENADCPVEEYRLKYTNPCLYRKNFWQIHGKLIQFVLIIAAIVTTLHLTGCNQIERTEYMYDADLKPVCKVHTKVNQWGTTDLSNFYLHKTNNETLVTIGEATNTPEGMAEFLEAFNKSMIESILDKFEVVP